MTDLRVTWPQALAWRLERHLLDPVGDVTAAEVVRRLGAVPSMDESLAGLAVTTRSTTSAPGDLLRALEAGEVVKAFSFRGSMHYMAPEDAGVYLAVRAAGRQWERRSWVDHYRLRPEDWPDFRAAVREALADGPLTIPEVGERLAAHRAYRHLRPVFEEGAGTLIKPLSWQGDAGLGPYRDGRRTLRRFDHSPRWAGVPDLDEAGPRAVLAYVRTYGPAPTAAVEHWLGKGLSAGAKRLASWVAGLADHLVTVSVDGTPAHVVRDEVDRLATTRPSDVVRLLPGHDQWVMGAGTADVHVTPPALRDLMTRKANPVLVGGVVRGTWSRREDDVTVTWLDDVHHGPVPSVAAVEAEARRLGSVLGRDLRVVVG